MDNSFVKLEWELLQDEITSERLLTKTGLSPEPSSVKVCRDDQLAIIIKMYREKASHQESDFSPTTRRGEIIKGQDVQFSLSPVSKLIIHNLIHGGNNQKGRQDFLFDVDMKVSSGHISNVFDTNNSTAHVFQYLIGFDYTGMLPSGCSRDNTGSASLKRNFSDKSLTKFDIKLTSGSGGSGWDSIYIKNSHGELVLTSPPLNKEISKFQPAYFHFSGEPRATEKEYRDKWIEAISFVLGKRMLAIGHSFFSKDYYPVRKEAYTPYSTSFKKEVFSPALPPFNLIEDGNYFLSENKVSLVTQLILDEKADLCLSEVFWKLWVAKAMPLGLNFVGFSAALEKLIDSWFSSQGEKQASLYVERKEYKNFIDPIREDLKEKTDIDEGWHSVNERLHIPNTLSGAEKKRRFFSSLGLEIGEVEKEAMNARNKYAHGETYFKDEPILLLRLTRAFETLLNRCILACIGYQGNYIDYSSLDFPERPLSERLGGKNGDGKLSK